MSDTSQGPGWWLASDGKWYPPETAPNQPPPAPPQGLQQPPPMQTVPLQTPAQAKSNRGCLIAALVVFGLFVVLGGGACVAITVFADDVAEDALGGGPCPFLSDDEAEDILGEGTTAIETSGLSNVLDIIDPRVMPNDPSCALFDGESQGGGLGRVARYEGRQASEKYDEELEKAKGITEDQGGGISVTSEEYLNRELENFGDEAFCTKSSGLGAGVLVREGDELVYVSVVADVNATPGVDLSDPDNPKLGTDEAHCLLAQEVASVVLD